MKKFLLVASIFLSVFFISYRAIAQNSQTVINGNKTTAVNFPAGGCTYNWVNNTPGIGLPASGTGDIAAFKAVNTGTTTITATITATPTGSGFAYIANSGSGTVSVINIATNNVIATIPVGQTPFGVSTSPDGNRAYVTNKDSKTVSVIDTKKNSVIATIGVGRNPTGVVVSADGSRVYVVNSWDDTISVIDVSTNSVINTISVGNGPTGLVISPDGQHLYVTCSESNTVWIIDLSGNSSPDSFGAGLYPNGILFSPDGTKLYVTTLGLINGELLTFNPSTNSRTSTVTLNTAEGAWITPDGRQMYVANVFNVKVVDLNTNMVIATVPVGSFAYGISASSDGKKIYVTNSGGNTVSVIDPTTNQVENTITVGSQPVSFGNFTTPNTNCTSSPITFTITVKPSSVTPVITAGSVTGTISACQGSPSASPNIEQFTVSGTGLTNNITATAPAGFEVSLSATGVYGSTATIPQAGGLASNTTVYVRSAASATGSITGNVTLSSQGANSQNVAVSGTINPLISVDPVSNQTLTNGSKTTAVKFTGTAKIFNWVNSTPGIGLPASGTGDITSFTAVNNGTSPVTATITVVPVSTPYAYIGNSGAGGGTVSVINTVNNAVIATIPTGQSPIGVAISPDGTTAYIANQQSNTISVIDAATNKVTATISEYQGAEPSGIVVSPDGTKLYVANYNSYLSSGVYIYSTATNTLITSIPVGDFPYGVVISHDGKRIYTEGAGGVTVIDAVTNKIITTITVGAGDNAYISISPDDSKLYVSSGQSNTISVIDAATNQVISVISVGNAPTASVSSPDGSKLYVANTLDNTISIINTSTNSVTNTIGAGSFPQTMDITPDGKTIYVTNGTSRSVTVIDASTYKTITRIPVGAGPFSVGSFISAGSGCTDKPITFTITVNPTHVPQIASMGNLSPLSTTYGTASTSSSFSVSGANMNAGILVTPPSGFEVSTNNTNFSQTVTVGTTGTIAATTVYIRLTSKTPVGNYSDNITLSSNGATDVNVSVPNSVVSPAPLTITASDAQKTFGQTLTNGPVLTGFTANGLQNNETVGSVFLTYGDGTDVSAKAGTYPGSVIPSQASGGSFDPNNYTITYKTGDIIVTETLAGGPISIPNAFTPNGDGINDVWNIKSLIDYPSCLVSIFTRYGGMVYQSRGYTKPWDGVYNGNLLPTGTYYYIINLQNGQQPLSGYVALIR